MKAETDPRPAAAPDWHALDSAAVLAHLHSAAGGLDPPEAAARLAEHGPNALPPPRPISPVRLLLKQFRNLLIVILLIAAALAALIASPVESLVIAIIVVLSVVLGFVQEYRAERAIEALREMHAPAATVLRGGRQLRVPSRDLVPGDVMVLQDGQRIAADGRVLAAVNLATDESPLTGESLPVTKTTEVLTAAAATPADRSNIVYSGSTVARGHGEAVVVATGMHTEFGRIAGLLRGVQTVATPLQKNLARVGRLLAAAAGIIVISIVAFGLLRGEPLMNMFIFGIALAVAAVPEALPAVVTISLALGVQRMARRNAVVRNLPAVETLGSTSVICADKTGTLTRDEMAVREILVAGVPVTVSGGGRELQGEFSWPEGKTPQTDLIEEILRAGVLCSNARINTRAGAPEVAGDPTEGALLIAAAKAGLHRDALFQQAPRIDETVFESSRKYMLTRHRGGAGDEIFCKGAPEVVLQMCSHQRNAAGTAALDAAARQQLLDTAAAMAGRALRVLAIAGGTDSEDNLVFLGLAGMMDPPRAETAAAIGQCRSAGIRPVMITGDHPVTAAAIAAEIGLSQRGRAITGAELDAMDDAGLASAIDNIDVYARVLPEHKLRVISAWQERGQVVAMTGDGVNDAPALKQADIGIAMGIKGTDVAREAADITLLDDNFASIVGAVEEGRGIFSNIRKYLAYLLSSNLGEIGLMAIAVFAGLPLPLTAVQILYINLATDGLPALALSVDPPAAGIMRRPPRDPATGIFSRRVVALTVAGGAWSLLVNLALFTGVLYSGRPLADAMAMTFVSLVLIQFFKAYSFRTIDDHVWNGAFANRWLNLAIVWEVFLLLLIVYTPFLQKPFNTVTLGATDWLIVTVLGATVVPVLELTKHLSRRD